MSEETAHLPGFWRFVWLFWMQPVTLHRLLRSLDVDPMQSGWKLLRRRRSPGDNWWLVRSAQMLLLITLGLTVSVFAALGRRLDWNYMALGVGFGVAFGMGCVLVDVAVGLALGVAEVEVAVVGVALVDLPVSVAFGVAATGVALVVGACVSLDVGFGVTFGRGFEAKGKIVDTVITLLPALFRIPVYLLEIICQMAARYWNSMTGRKSLHWVPVLHHELSYLPHPFLESHILAEEIGRAHV